MAMSYRVKMEYPFPPNNNAQLVAAWNEAANQIEADNPKELNEQVVKCLGEAQDMCERQRLELVGAMQEYIDVANINNVTVNQTVTQGWKLMMHLSNYIRCVASLGDLDGEMYGLQVLMDFMAGDGDE